MNVVVAPEKYSLKPNDLKVFLGGGITGCEDWQSQTIASLQNKLSALPSWIYDNVVVFNPRRALFDVTDKNASVEQIEWEFMMLEQMDIFSMYFSSEQIQPICLYELGRNLLSMKSRFPESFLKRICISCPKEYERAQDVSIQTSLALFGEAQKFSLDEHCYIDGKLSPETHSQLIVNSIVSLFLEL